MPFCPAHSHRYCFYLCLLEQINDDVDDGDDDDDDDDICLAPFVMAAYGIGQAIIFLPVVSFFFFLLFFLA